MEIVITKNLGYGMVEGFFQGKKTRFIFDYVYKNGIETEILCSEDKDYWYLKTLHVEKDDEDDVVSVEVEDTIYNDCIFYQVIDKNTQKIVDYNASYEDIEVIKENLERDKFLKEISKEEFLKNLNKK